MVEASTTADRSQSSSTPTAPRRRVTDAPTRMFHWLFALSFTGAYLTADSERWRHLHVTLGYLFAALLGFRVLYGLLGPRQVRLSILWRKLGALRTWFISLRNPKGWAWANVQQLPNLLMTASVASMLVMVIPLTLSGYATFNEWGGRRLNDWLEDLHEFFGNVFLIALLTHLSIIALWLLLRRSSRVTPMLTGLIPGSGPNLVRHNHGWLAVALLAAVVSLGCWLW